MTYLEYYRSLSTLNEDQRELFCRLLEKNPAAIIQFSKITSSHIGERDLKRLFPLIFPILINNHTFTLDDEILDPEDAFDLIESVLYLQILSEEFKAKSGRRGFFISNFKAVKPDWVYFSLEFLIAKAIGKKPKDLLSLFIGTKQYDLGILATMSEVERIQAFVLLTRRKMIGVFHDSMFMGFKNYKKINDIESIQQNLFEEITNTKDFFEKKGSYYDLFGDVSGLLTLPAEPVTKRKIPVVEKKIIIGPLQKNLALLSLSEMPTSKAELKKVFFRLAAATHPDKFEHIDKGTKTEIAIVDKFREIYKAYEYVENELNKKS